MIRIVKYLLIGIEDLLGLALLGIAAAALVGTRWPSPETTVPIGVVGYMFAALALSASVLFFVGANNLLRTKTIRPGLHLAAVACTMLIPLLGLALGPS